MMEWSKFEKVIRAALLAGRPDFAKLAAADWLAAWPGDLRAQLLTAQADMEQGNIDAVVERLRRTMSQDPECIEVYALLSSAYRTLGDPNRARLYRAAQDVLLDRKLEQDQAPSWAHQLQQARRAMQAGAYEDALTFAQQALQADLSLALPTIVAVRVYLARGDFDEAVALARAGHDRWPECVAFNLVLAMNYFNEGRNSRAVSYLHRAASFDLDGHIAASLLGPDHAYRSLWPTAPAIDLERPLPAAVAALLGANKLTAAPEASPSEPEPGGSSQSEPIASTPAATPQAEPASPALQLKQPPQQSPAAPSVKKAAPNELPKPEPWESFRGPNPGDAPSSEVDGLDLQQIQDDFGRIARRLSTRRPMRDEDGRSPAYIVLSSRTRLAQAYGEDAFEDIDAAVMSLVEAVRRHPGWSAYRIYIDDPTTLNPFGLNPADPGNAWQIKLRIADLDLALKRRSEMIGALLIVGGGAIIPFHMLPNPTDDDDEIIPSDNPYAASDENYFAPQWAVGRMPDDGNHDLLIAQLRSAITSHVYAIPPSKPLLRFRIWLARKLGIFVGGRAKTLGYTASIWRKASLAVYRSIGDPGSLLVSPPAQAPRLPSMAMRPVRLSYYNLHGLEDAPEWYGQRDPLRDADAQIEFPIALRPDDVINSGRAPKIVFTEACYGANIIGRTREDALCLKFLSSGSHAVIGSTKISYGSVTPPLIAADLLGRIFWQNINQLLPVGEALRRAKLRLASEMHQRQGYLDGEDQKTLISFVLYGDPLYQPSMGQSYPGEKNIIRRTTRPNSMKTVCALGEGTTDQSGLSSTEREKIDSIVAKYLPGMRDAVCHIHPQHLGCSGEDHHCPTHQLGMKAASPSGKNTKVVTLSKSIPIDGKRHPHFARLTLGPSGKVIKLAISR